MGSTDRVDDVLELVGDTPLIRLDSATPPAGARVWGKAEHVNPGGSLKDRIGVALIEAAEADGDVEPGDLLVEASSGNTAIALAQVCAVKGYDLVITIPEKMSEEKRRLVEAFGAETVVTPNADPGDEEHYRVQAERIAEERGGYVLDQFANPANSAAHEATTGPEIAGAFETGPEALVAGAGTGGTITGIARALEEAGRDTRIVCADPEGSVIHGGQAEPYRVEGIGDDFVPECLDQDLVDGYEVVSDAESFAVARRLAREEGLLVGGSSGATVAAATRVAERLEPEADVVAILGDTGRNYVSKIFDDDWLVAEGLGHLVEDQPRRADPPSPHAGGSR